MDTVRMFADVRVKDYAGAMVLLNQVARFAEENHPGVLAWDCYFDESGEHMTWFQEHTDQRTLLEYEKAVAGHWDLEEFGRVLDMERLIVLGKVTDPELLEFFLRFPAVPVERTFGISR